MLLLTVHAVFKNSVNTFFNILYKSTDCSQSRFTFWKYKIRCKIRLPRRRLATKECNQLQSIVQL